MVESRITRRRHLVVNAFLMFIAIVQIWLIWFALPYPNETLVMSVGTLWMVTLINGLVIESGALAIIALALGGRHLAIDAPGMSTGLSIAAMIGTAAVGVSFAFRFQRALRSDQVSFPTFAWSSERRLSGFCGGTWVVAAGTLLVSAASVLDIVERYNQGGPDATFLCIMYLVLAVCLVGLGATYVVREVRASRNP
jgi:hypothetical protein